MSARIVAYRSNEHYYMTHYYSQETKYQNLRDFFQLLRESEDQYETIIKFLKLRLWISYNRYAKDNYVNTFKLDKHGELVFTCEEFRIRAEKAEMDYANEEDESENNSPPTPRPEHRELMVEVAARWPDVDYEFKLNDTHLFLELLPISGRIALDGVWSDFPPTTSLYSRRPIIVDLDREVVSLQRDHQWWHYPLRNVPRSYLSDLDGAIEVDFEPPALIDQDLVTLYNSVSPSIFESTDLVPRTNRIRRDIMKAIMLGYCDPSVLFGNKEAAYAVKSSSITLRKAVQALIKLSSWDNLKLLPIPRGESVENSDSPGEKFTNVEIPKSDTYILHDDPRNKVIIHVSSRLDIDYKSAIGHVLVSAKQMNVTGNLTACILSAAHVLVAKIDIEGDRYNVSHCQPTPLLYETHCAGWDLLTSVLSPATNNVQIHTSNATLPQELFDRIFQEYCLCNGRVDILNWRLACKQLNQIADQWTIPLPRLTILNFPGVDNENGSRYARNETGKLVVWDWEWLMNPKQKLKYRPVDRKTGKAIGTCALKLYLKG